MEIDWHSLPPLSALRAFEATARLGGFTAAARTLNVTHAAVAQQVRALEQFFGVSLVQREGRALGLTAEGRDLAASLSDGFGVIQTGVRSLRQQGSNRPLRLSLSPGVAAQWLMPRLRWFWAAHPDIPLSLHPDHRIVDLQREGFDLAIRYGKGSWKGVEATYLTSARFVITGAPSLLNGTAPPTLADMQALPWISAADWPEQTSWLASIGLDPKTLRISEFPSEDLAIAAARQGLGLLVESHALVEDDIAHGRLVLLRDTNEPLPAYFIVTTKGPQRKTLQIFIKWLLSVA